MREPPGWNDDRLALTLKLWAEGVSASKIAKHEGMRGSGLSRNAVLGKVHRLGKAERAAPSSPGNRVPAPRSATSRAPTPTRPPRMDVAVPRAPAPPNLPRVDPPPRPTKPRHDPGLITMPSAHTCKWPIGDPMEPGFRFCQHPAASRRLDGGDLRDLPYCEEHCLVAYQPPAPKKPAKAPRPDFQDRRLAAYR